MISCPSCGAELLFDIASQKMICAHCKNSFEPGSLNDNIASDAKTEPYYESYAYTCPSCGAEVETTDKNDAVGFCPYCKGSSMIFDKLRKEWVPDGIVPFKITKEQCKELYRREVKKHFFVSRKYKEPELIEDFRGIYMPYSRFTGIVDGEVSFRARSAEKDIGDYNYQTKFYDMKGTANYTVKERIAHDVSAAFDDHISERLGEFDEKDIQKFHPAYLSGFYAESGNVDINEYLSVVRSEVATSICDHIKESPEMKAAAHEADLTVESDYSQNVVPMSIIPSNRRLFPVWFMSYRSGKHITYAAVNGQTGQVAADLPLSPWKILITAFVLSGVIFGLLLAAMNFLPTIPASAVLGICTSLGFMGMYVLQHAYIKTVGSALHQKDLTASFPFGFIVSSVILLTGIILATTDGTYEQNRYFIGMILTGISLFFLLIGYFVAQAFKASRINTLKLTKISMQSNGILVEARRFSLINFLMRTAMIITHIFLIFMVFRVTPNNEFYYMLSGVSAIELFILALMHISFQIRIAKRRLPQFNKEGATYDKI